MKVLIVESECELGFIWQRALERLRVQVVLVTDQATAVQALRDQSFELIILDLVLENGSAFAISDFANYRRPAAQVMFVTNTSFFSDGSIFQHCSNACAYVAKCNGARRYRHDGDPLRRACLKTPAMAASIR
ncbi:hypothetical protein ACMAY7_03330 [Rhodobacteraceae bacterium nBUS_24]